MQEIEINNVHIFEHEVNANVQPLGRLSIPPASVFLKLQIYPFSKMAQWTGEGQKRI